MNDCRPIAGHKASACGRAKQRWDAERRTRGTPVVALRRGVWVLVLALACGLAGCGQKGDLYLPDEAPEKAAER